MKTIVSGETNIIIGENAKENWELLDTNQNYLWLHLRSFPSCFVIIQDDSPSNLTLLEAACLCKQNTKYRDLRNVKVNYTKISNIQKADKCGAVTFISNRQVSTITV
jgi:predicted ribosome quality control (RQC) complex YloA/Tae2 family protein|tara:strand:+ start:1847 stop:2167 length:321 start_codon:yes stop_codon:yes gene_type:complete